MRERRDAGKEGYRKGGSRKIGMQEMIHVNARIEGCRKGGMHKGGRQ